MQFVQTIKLRFKASCKIQKSGVQKLQTNTVKRGRTDKRQRESKMK